MTTDKPEYEVKDKFAHLNVSGSPNAYVMVQMVDHAVFILNNARTLTPSKVLYFNTRSTSIMYK